MAVIPYEAWLILKEAGLAGKMVYIPKKPPEIKVDEEIFAELMARFSRGENLTVEEVKEATGLSHLQSRRLLEAISRRVKEMKDKGLDPEDFFSPYTGEGGDDE